jgi:ribosome-associated protein
MNCPNPILMLQITQNTAIAIDEISLTAVRSQGAGGQNVNRVSTAIHLRFDINASSLPPLFKERLLNLSDRRITKDGVIIIKAQQHRTQEQNKDDALKRLQILIKSITTTPRVRRVTKPSLRAQSRRIDNKTKRGEIKAARANITNLD